MKKLTAFLLAALLVFSCAACEPDPGESANEPTAPKVVDAEAYSQKFNGENFSFVIPKIEYAKTGVEALNTEIRETLYKSYLSNVKAYLDKEEFPIYENVYYKWGFKDRYLTIAEIFEVTYSNNVEISAFYIDLETMALITDPYQILDAFGLTKTAFTELARTSIAAVTYDYIKEFLNGDEFYLAVQAEQLFRDIVGTENVAAAKPVIGENGNLAILCTLGSLAGAATYQAIIPATDKLSAEAAAYLENFDFNMPTDYTSLVEDGTVYNISRADFSVKLVAPTIYSPHGRQDDMNALLTAEVEKILASTINEGVAGGSVYDDLLYTWGFSGHYLSVAMTCHVAGTSASDCFVYNFDVFSGKLIDDTELLHYFDIYDPVAFKAQVKGVAGSFCLRKYKSAGFDELVADAFDYTIRDDVAADAMPFIGIESNLCVAAKIGSVAGPRFIWEFLHYDDEISNEFYQHAAKG